MSSEMMGSGGAYLSLYCSLRPQAELWHGTVQHSMCSFQRLFLTTKVLFKPAGAVVLPSTDKKHCRMRHMADVLRRWQTKLLT